MYACNICNFTSDRNSSYTVHINRNVHKNKKTSKTSDTIEQEIIKIEPENIKIDKYTQTNTITPIRSYTTNYDIKDDLLDIIKRMDVTINKIEQHQNKFKLNITDW